MEAEYSLFFDKRVPSSIALTIVVLCGLFAAGLIINRVQRIVIEVPPIYVSHIPQRMIGERTLSWETYRNEEHRFEIKYPSDWQIIRESYFYNQVIALEVSFAPNNATSSFGAPLLVVHTEGIENAKKAPAYGSIESAEENIRINSINAIKQYRSGALGEFETYFIPNDQYVFELRCEGKQFKDVFNQMLSTFKFID